ncbi:MAG: phosphopantothenate/pantothenate synthetase family protein, partial [Candidatus Anstonellales archaeon]
KFVIAIDLNPLSRTAKEADITIVDNLIRVMPLFISYYKKLGKLDRSELNKIINSFNNKKNLRKAEKAIRQSLK